VKVLKIQAFIKLVSKKNLILPKQAKILNYDEILKWKERIKNSSSQQQLREIINELNV